MTNFKQIMQNIIETIPHKEERNNNFLYQSESLRWKGKKTKSGPSSETSVSRSVHDTQYCWHKPCELLNTGTRNWWRWHFWHSCLVNIVGSIIYSLYMHCQLKYKKLWSTISPHLNNIVSCYCQVPTAYKKYYGVPYGGWFALLSCSFWLQ